MDDYSHCHYWDNKIPCIAFECEGCKHKRQHDAMQEGKIDLTEWMEWNKLFEVD